MKHGNDFRYALTLAAAAAFAISTTASGQGYPSRAVRFVLPQAAGGGVDIMTRAVAQKLTETWGQPVIVDNRPGANGIIGIDAVAKAKPDGYTLSSAFTSVLTINPHVYKSLPYDTLRDFVPISQAVTNTIVLMVHPSLPVRSVGELVALAKAQPGKIDYGSFGVGNVTHLGGELLAVEAGIKMMHVPFKGETPALTGLIGGQVAVAFAVSSAAAPHIRSGRSRILATGGEKRSPAWPDTPTLVESGYPKVTITGWNGFLAPKGTPREIVEKVARDSARHLLGPDLKERLSALGAEPNGTAPEAFTAFIKAESEKWERVTKAAGIYKSQ